MLSKRTCALTFWCQLVGSLLTAKHAYAATATFRNQCAFQINVHDTHSNCHIDGGDSASPTSGCDRDIDQSAVYRHGTGDQGMLVEFSYGDNKVWYDITTLPPGAVDCSSYEECATTTGKVGFNIGVMIEPTSPDDDASFACSSLLCQYAECPDSFHFPSDAIKVKNCPEHQHFNITFCP